LPEVVVVVVETKAAAAVAMEIVEASHMEDPREDEVAEANTGATSSRA
jgi:hypothetical protein